MTELLVWSLLGGGGLRDALRNALQTHQSDSYNHLQLDEYVSSLISNFFFTMSSKIKYYSFSEYDQIDIVTGQRGSPATTMSDDSENVQGITCT